MYNLYNSLHFIYILLDINVTLSYNYYMKRDYLHKLTLEVIIMLTIIIDSLTTNLSLLITLISFILIPTLINVVNSH